MATCLQNELGAAISFSAPQGGMFIWARMAEHDTQAFSQRALEKLVAFVPGKPFYAQECDTQTLRLSFATSNIEAISEGVTRLRQAL
jgi:DNA-binding transcriptional MocR family regulator